MQKFWGVILALTTMVSCKEGEVQKKDIAQDIGKIEKPVLNERFGFNLDEFHVKLDTIKYGDSFGELMQQHKVDYPKVAAISENFRDTFDVRKIRVGKPYVILQSKDTMAQAQVFIYENDPINYTVVDLRDTVKVYKEKNKVKYVQREVSGIIESSLSEAILQQGVDYNVTHNLANVYAWTIDFSRLQKNDKFKIIYNEKYINDTVYAGAEPIEAAYFQHNGKPIYAFAYENDSLRSIVDYFDENANNLRRTFLRMPVEYGRLSSRYNLK